MSSSDAKIGLTCSVLAFMKVQMEPDISRKQCWLLERLQKRRTRVSRGLEKVSEREGLKEIRLFNLINIEKINGNSLG